MADRTLGAFLEIGRRGVDRLDARLLLQHVCGLSHAQIIGGHDLVIPEDRWQRLLELVERRRQGEPLAYLVGDAEFRGRRFAVTPDVLIPRPETEELVDLALLRLRETGSQGLPKVAGPRCADLGCGSGVIAISLKLEFPAAEVVATDVSSLALVVARNNGRELGAAIDWRQGSWLEPLTDETFDLIVSNPPYVAAGDPHLKTGGLPFEPALALTDGCTGGDGLACIRTIVAGAVRHLEGGGWLLLEHGHDQGEAIRNLLGDAGFEATFTQTDLSGNDRISGGRKPRNRNNVE